MEPGGVEMAERLLRSREVAALLDVHVMTVNRLRLSGKLGFVRVGKSVRFKQEHVDEFLARQERRPMPGNVRVEQAASMAH